MVWPGQWYAIGNAADLIEFNTYYMDNYTTAEKQNVVTHELGHALGIGDHYDTSNIMMYGVVTGRTTLATHDITDYHNIWGY